MDNKTSKPEYCFQCSPDGKNIMEGVCKNCETLNKKWDEEQTSKVYYRLLCLQGTGYMATGYNAESHKELFEAYASYKSNDWGEEMKEAWKGFSLKQKLNEIGADMFEIEQSNMPFDEAEIH